MARLAPAKPDVLHVQWLGAPEADRWLFLPHAPAVLTAHDIIPRRTASKTRLWRTLFGHEPERPPPYTRDWAELHGRETLAEAAGRHMVPVAISEIRPGDVLLFAMKDGSPAKHCAILTEPARMVHSIEVHPVAEVSLWSGLDRRRLRFAFAFPNLTD